MEWNGIEPNRTESFVVDRGGTIVRATRRRHNTAVSYRWFAILFYPCITYVQIGLSDLLLSILFGSPPRSTILGGILFVVRYYCVE